MAFEIQALQELKPNAKFKATEMEDGSFVLEWDVDINGGEAAPTMEEIKTKAQQIENEIPIRHLRKEEIDYYLQQIGHKILMFQNLHEQNGFYIAKH